MKNCNDCKWINITEEQQQDNSTNHICMKHKVRVIHRNTISNIHHNFIYPCPECNGMDFESR